MTKVIALPDKVHAELAAIRAQMQVAVKWGLKTREQVMHEYALEVRKRIDQAAQEVDARTYTIRIECGYCYGQGEISADQRTFSCQCTPYIEQFTFQQRIIQP